MPRRKTIDKAAILDAAESLITEIGGHNLTLDMVAARAGISKGGLTYSYPSKDALVADMLKKEIARFLAETESLQEDGSRTGRLKAHIEASAREKEIYKTRAAYLMAAISNRSEHTEFVRRFYRNVFDLTDPETPEGRRARLAFLAIEGAFLLRGLGLMEMTDVEWDEIYADALEMM